MAAAVPAWKVAAASAACLALAYTAVYVTQIEKRLPLVYYKRRAQVLHRLFPWKQCEAADTCDKALCSYKCKTRLCILVCLYLVVSR